MKNVLKKIAAVIAGLICCIALNALVVQFTIRYTEMEKLANPANAEKIRRGTADFDPMEITQRFVWRYQYIYIPAIIVLTTLLVSFIDRKTPPVTGLLANSPFLIIQLMTSGDSVGGIVLFAVYLLIIVALALLMRHALRPKQYSETPPSIEEMMAMEK